MATIPTVSVGVPVFNGARYLEETLRSLLAQDFEDFELVVSDNGSSDDTGAICQEVASQDGRVRYARQARNQGAAWNYNHLVALARGRYFTWSGHDDLYEPTYLGRCVEALEAAGPAVVLAYPRTVLIDAAGQRLRSYEDRLELGSSSPHRRLRDLLRNVGLANAVFGVIRTDVLATTRLIGAYNSSDLVLLCELALRGQFREVDDELFYRRIHAESSTRANSTANGVREWFTGTPSRAPLFPRTRRTAEFGRSIAQAPLGLGERAACLAVLARSWAPREAKHIARELITAVPAYARVRRA